uniref:ATP-dependent RNA helicase n=1 Tax=Octactis speculum TaxID=3111310 RepID=A0A7S2AYE4_9STRA
MVDILVCTPGRLVDHLEATPQFTLQHLRVMVVDEADRLLDQSYHGWVDKVYNAAFPKNNTEPSPAWGGDGCTLDLHPATVRGGRLSHVPPMPPVPLQRMLFSATLTSNPMKLAALNLKNPKFYSIGTPSQKNGHDDDGTGGGTLIGLPETLHESSVVVAGKDTNKPLVLLSLLVRHLTVHSGTVPSNRKDALEEHGDDDVTDDEEQDDDDDVIDDDDDDTLSLSVGKELVVVFTASTDSTHRLCRFLQLCAVLSPDKQGLRLGGNHTDADAIAEFSPALSATQRQSLMERCQKGEVRVLICSDGMSRGIDLDVSLVVNYDVPRHTEAYVHRVGRTARAGRSGSAVTLLHRGQEKSFSRLRERISKPNDEGVARHRVTIKEKERASGGKALGALKKVLDLERKSELSPMASLEAAAHIFDDQNSSSMLS